ncbi:hypothetical protein CDAR_590471 [Caerostris darwini]|uniref:Uncharacterized protein n=1 Tax=Caerostris darwini TaxID=1538125 RepID=A0AAV4TVB8_9ARAC|nr:hypothetical protein CDAR_590471 [Caerostris darwini]
MFAAVQARLDKTPPHYHEKAAAFFEAEAVDRNLRNNAHRRVGTHSRTTSVYGGHAEKLAREKAEKRRNPTPFKLDNDSNRALEEELNDGEVDALLNNMLFPSKVLPDTLEANSLLRARFISECLNPEKNRHFVDKAAKVSGTRSTVRRNENFTTFWKQFPQASHHSSRTAENTAYEQLHDFATVSVWDQ